MFLEDNRFRSLPFNVLHRESGNKLLQFSHCSREREGTAHLTETVAEMFPCQFSKTASTKMPSELFETV